MPLIWMKHQKQKRIADSEPMEFSHTFDTQIGGQIAAGFVITGFLRRQGRTGSDGPTGEIYGDVILSPAL